MPRCCGRKCERERSEDETQRGQDGSEQRRSERVHGMERGQGRIELCVQIASEKIIALFWASPQDSAI